MQSKFLILLTICIILTVTTVQAETLWVGDSRTVGMSNVVSINSIAKVGSGLKWLKRQNIPTATASNSHIVFNHGVNDPTNIEDYVKYYKTLIPQLEEKGYKVHILSVNPILSNYHGSIKQSQIDHFNSRIKTEFPEYYVDSTRLKFISKDGLHYNSKTYQEIFNFVEKEIYDTEKINTGISTQHATRWVQ